MDTLTCTEGDQVECDFCKKRISEDFTQACFVFDKDLEQVIKHCSKAERRQHLDKFLKMVNVLLNQGGGVIYIHTQQHLLAFWDEQVDENLMDLVPDNTLFHDNFERHVIAHEKHVIFRVKPRHRPLSTREFNSKVSLNKGLVDPTHLQMRRLMQTDREHPEVDSVGNHYDDSCAGNRMTVELTSLKQGQVVQFNENVDLQAKVVEEKKLSRARGAGRSNKLLNYWWAGDGQGLKLPQYIAAFTKQVKGGSFFLGLREHKIVTGTRWTAVPNTEGMIALFDSEKKFWKDDKNDNLFHLAVDEHVPKWEHKTGEFICEGIRLTTREKDEIEQQLKDRVHQHLLWLSITEAGTWEPNPPNDIVEVFFHPVLVVAENDRNSTSGCQGGRISQNGNQEASQFYMIEAKVKYFHGVCFQTKDGPEAYVFENPDKPHQVQHVEIRDWVNHQRCNS